MDRLTRYLLISALIYGAALRFYAISNWKQGLSHDESVSYLCASATEGAYQNRIPALVDSYSTVGAIQGLYARPENVQLATVSSDLSRYDIHPPLYFWALHLQHTLVGSGITGGMWLNFIAGLGLLLFTFLFARNALGSVDHALAACAILYLAPAVTQIDLEARQYQFMALCAMVSYLLTQRRLLGIAGAGELLLFTLVNAFGMLSHYYYAFILVPGLVLVWRAYRWTVPTLTYGASLLGSLLLFMVLFPEFIEFVSSYTSRVKEAKEAAGLIDRIKTILYASLAFFTQAHLLRYVFLGLGLLGLGMIVLRAWKERARRVHFGGAIGQVMITLLWCVSFTVALYLVGISPPHAVGEQYFSYFWPLLAIALVYVARRVFDARYRTWILYAYMLQLGISSTLAVRSSGYLEPILPAGWYEEIRNSDLLVTDDRKRSFLPRAMRTLPEALPLFIMEREKPHVGTMDRVHYLRLEIPSRPPAAEFTTWMTEHGFAHGEVLVHGHHELHTYTR